MSSANKLIGPLRKSGLGLRFGPDLQAPVRLRKNSEMDAGQEPGASLCALRALQTIPDAFWPSRTLVLKDGIISHKVLITRYAASDGLD